MARELKQLIVDELTRRTEGMDRCVIIGFTELSAEASRNIRARLRQANITLHVVKNSLMARAFANVGLDALTGVLNGPCAVVSGADDVLALTRDVTQLVTGTAGLSIVAGYGEGELLSADDVRRFAAIPSRAQLLSRFLGVASTPLGSFVGVLARLETGFVTVLDAVRKKQMTNSKHPSPTGGAEE